MAFQLLNESWIPVRRADGLEWIPPWRITDRGRRGRVLDVASVRPDFDGAFLEFLIGLVQTVLTPATEDEWFDRWDTPPAPDELREAMEPFRDAFVLDGDGPRFMQNHEALEECDSPRPIAWLFMDAPSENTEKENRDLFIKRRGFQRLCPGCAAAALFTLQTFASSGGSGTFRRSAVRAHSRHPCLAMTSGTLSGPTSLVAANSMPTAPAPRTSASLGCRRRAGMLRRGRSCRTQCIRFTGTGQCRAGFG